MFVRVKDKSTGHEFDVPESDPRIGDVFTPVSKKHYPPSPVIRRPKHNLSPTKSTTEPSTVTEETKEESENG